MEKIDVNDSTALKVLEAFSKIDCLEKFAVFNSDTFLETEDNIDTFIRFTSKQKNLKYVGVNVSVLRTENPILLLEKLSARLENLNLAGDIGDFDNQVLCDTIIKGISKSSKLKTINGT